MSSLAVPWVGLWSVIVAFPQFPGLTPTVFMRGSRNFVRGGPGQSDKKSSDKVFFFFFFFFSPQLILRKSNGQFQ